MHACQFVYFNIHKNPTDDAKFSTTQYEGQGRISFYVVCSNALFVEYTHFIYKRSIIFIFYLIIIFSTQATAN